MKTRKLLALILAAALVALLSAGTLAFAAPNSGGAGQNSAGNIDNGLDVPDFSKVPTANSAMPSWYPPNVNTFQHFHNDASTPRVVDNADILPAADEKELAETIADMRERLGMDFVIFTDTSTHGLSRAVYAADFYEFNGYGVGDDYNGLVIFICMEQGNRGWWTAACGACRQQITEGNLNQVDDAIEPYMRSFEFGNAMRVYLERMDTLYTYGFFPPQPQVYGIAGIVALGVGAVIGWMNRRRKVNAMRTVEKAVEASNYVEKNGFSLRVCDDAFLRTTVTRTRRVQVQSSGGKSSFSGGYHSSGGGSFSGGGRGF